VTIRALSSPDIASPLTYEDDGEVRAGFGSSEPISRGAKSELPDGIELAAVPA
jgi:hypothetical protein